MLAGLAMPHPILAVLSEGQCAYPQLCGSCSKGALILFIASSVLYISCAMHFFMCAAEGIRDALLGVWEEALGHATASLGVRQSLVGMARDPRRVLSSGK